MKPQLTKRTIVGQPSFIINNDCIELALTCVGGNMAPVTFFADTDAPARPYWISPWQMEGLPLSHDYMDVFRGDFFCIPFGQASPTYHGQAAALPWTPVNYSKEGNVTDFTLHLDMTDPACSMDKQIRLRDGENNLYIRHSFTGLEGAYSYSHHATLDVSPERPVVVSVSAFNRAATVGAPGNYNERESSYMFTLGGQTIDGLEKVPTTFGDPAYVDCSHMPAAVHYSGAIQVISKKADTPSWTCVWFPKENFVWFAMKNVDKQPITHFWLEHGGRFQYPWNGRTMCIAVEDMCMSFPASFRERFPERAEMMRKMGMDMDRSFEKDKRYNVNYIEGAIQVCPDFGKVTDIRFEDGCATFVTENGNEKKIDVDWKFVYGE